MYPTDVLILAGLYALNAAAAIVAAVQARRAWLYNRQARWAMHQCRAYRTACAGSLAEARRELDRPATVPFDDARPDVIPLPQWPTTQLDTEGVDVQQWYEEHGQPVA